MKDHTFTEQRRGPAILSIGKVLFGTAAIVVRLVPVHTFAFLLALHAIAVAGFYTQTRKELASIIRRGFWPILAVSLAFLVNDFAYYAAVKTMNITVATLVRWVAPVFVVTAAFAVGERFTRRSVLAAWVAFGGLVTLLAERGVAYTEANMAGIALSLLSAISVAAYWMGAKVVLRSMSANALLFVRSLIALPILAVVTVTGFRSELAVAGEYLPHLFAFGIVYGILSAWFDTVGIQETSARQAAVLGYLVPLTTILLSAILLDERMTPLMALGGAMILAGGYLIRAHKIVHQRTPTFARRFGWAQ